MVGWGVYWVDMSAIQVIKWLVRCEGDVEPMNEGGRHPPISGVLSTHISACLPIPAIGVSGDNAIIPTIVIT
jgi:hypothetical protein